MFESCRYCGSGEVHTREYGKPTFNCAKHLREENSELRGQLERLIQKTNISQADIDRLVTAAQNVVWEHSPLKPGSVEYVLRKALEPFGGDKE